RLSRLDRSAALGEVLRKPRDRYEGITPHRLRSVPFMSDGAIHFQPSTAIFQIKLAITRGTQHDARIPTVVRDERGYVETGEIGTAVFHQLIGAMDGAQAFAHVVGRARSGQRAVENDTNLQLDGQPHKLRNT